MSLMVSYFVLSFFPRLSWRIMSFQMVENTMANALDHEIASLVDCTRLLVWKIFSTHFPNYQVDERITCNDGNLSGVLFAKELLQKCNNGIEEMVLHLERTLCYNGCCDNVSFASRVSTLRPLINCCYDVCNNLEKRSCDLTREAQQIHSSCLFLDAHPTGKLRQRTDELETEATGLKQMLTLKDEALMTLKKEQKKLLTRTGEQEEESTTFKHRLSLKDEETIIMKKENEVLLTRNDELIKEVMEFKQRLDLRDAELMSIKMEKEELMARTDDLEKEVAGFKQNLHLKDEELIAIQKEIKELSKRNDLLEKEVMQFKQRRYLRDEELMAIEKGKEELCARLSQYTSAQLVHDNRNVADLSDLNRPTKLAEKLSELYDNEWTDGFEVLTENYKLTGTAAIQQLLDILMDAYTYCTNISNKQEEMMKQALLSPVADYTGEDQQTELNNVQLRNIFDLRKQTSHRSLTTVQKGFLDNVRISGQKSTDVTQLIKYIDQCAELCWHMVIRSPPLVFETPASKGSEFDKTKYRFYQTSGMNLNFVVWPVLRLHENGPLLSRGIAEAL